MTYAFLISLRTRSPRARGCSSVRRRDVHGRVARALEDGGDESAALLSLHFFEAGEHDKAWECAVLAGERAQATFANVTLPELYGACDCGGGASSAARRRRRAVASVFESLGDVSQLFGSYDAAMAALARALGLPHGLAGSGRAAAREAEHGLGAHGRRGCARRLRRRTRPLWMRLRRGRSATRSGDAGAQRGCDPLIARRTTRKRFDGWRRPPDTADIAGDRRTLAHAYSSSTPSSTAIRVYEKECTTSSWRRHLRGTGRSPRPRRGAIEPRDPRVLRGPLG